MSREESPLWRGTTPVDGETVETCAVCGCKRTTYPYDGELATFPRWRFVAMKSIENASPNRIASCYST